MESKLIAMIVVVAIVLATMATVYTQSAYAFRGGFGRGFNGGHGEGPPGPYCANPNVGQNNPNCAS